MHSRPRSPANSSLRKVILVGFLIALLSALGIPFVTRAQYWDPGNLGAAPGSGGNGTWDVSSSAWNYSSGDDAPWSNGDAAEFAGVAGTVMVAAVVPAGIIARSLTFATSGYTLTGATGATVALDAASGINASALSSGTTTFDVPLFLITAHVMDGFDVGSGATLSLNDSVSGSSGMLFTGPGTVTLGASNSYKGGTMVEGGNLCLANGSGSATGNGDLLVLGGTVSGTGISNSPLAQFLGGALIAPGINSGGPGDNFGPPGTLTLLAGTGGLSLTNANFDFDLASTETAGDGVNDLLAVGGAVAFGSLAFTFNELDGSLLTGTPYTLLDGASSESGFNPAHITTSFTGTSYGATYTYSSVNGLQVTFSTIPEPSAWELLMGVIALAFTVARRESSKILRP